MSGDRGSDVGDRGRERREASRTSRRSVIRTAAAGAALTAGGVVLQSSSAASTSTGRSRAESTGTTAFGLVCRIDQDAENFIAYGFLTEVAGIPDEVLFGDEVDRSEATAPLTIAGDATLERRSVRGNVFVLDVVGSLAIHLLDTPGADFADPSSFSDGKVVARYSAAFHDVLTVIAPDTGIPTLSGELEQTAATNFTLGGKRYRIGSKGTRLVLEGTGLGVRTDAEAPRSHVDLDARVSVV
jgi:hypothetical protein